MTGQGLLLEGGMDHPLLWTLRELKWRVVGSIVLPIVWTSVTLLFYGFWATGLSLTQDVVVGVVSVLTLLATIAAMWFSLAFGVARKWVSD